jgi:hypothetical protein
VPTVIDDLVPPDCPGDVRARAADPPREPLYRSDAGYSRRTGDHEPTSETSAGRYRRFLGYGLQSGAVLNTDLSFPRLSRTNWGGWINSGTRAIPAAPADCHSILNTSLRDLENRFGSETSGFELQFARFRSRQLLDGLEDYWERGPGGVVAVLAGYMHAVGIYGWDLRDALSKSATT